MPIRNLPVAVYSFSIQGAGVMVRRAIFILVLGGGTLAALPLCAQQGQPVTSLAEAARSAGKNFRQVTPDDVARAKAELTAAIGSLDAFLRTGAPYKAVG